MGVKIIMAICFLPCLLIMYGCLYMEGKPKGNIIMGVTLRAEEKDEAGVKQIVKRFHREMHVLLLLSLVLFALTCMPTRDSIVLSTQMIWLVFVLVVFFFPEAKGNRRLREWKRERRAACPQQATPQTAEPEIQNAQKVYVDMTAAAAPRSKPFLKLSLAGLGVSFIPVIGELFLAREAFYGWWTEGTLLILFLCGLLCCLLQWRFWRMSTDVVSLRSEVNIQLARVRQYQWSRFWSIMIWCTALLIFLMWYGMHRPKAFLFLILGGVCLYTLAAAVAALFTERNVRRAYGKYTETSEFQVEEDDHWIYGMFYYNRNDSRFMVNKRVGIGTTVNMAKTSAKVFTGVILAGTLALLLWAAGFVLLEDFATISLKVADSTVISAQYQEEYRIEISDIQSVELVDTLPSMSKRVGSSMDTLLKGSFLSEGYVSCKVCVRRQKPPFVKITATDGMVYYLNDEEAHATVDVYEELRQMLGSK